MVFCLQSRQYVPRLLMPLFLVVSCRSGWSSVLEEGGCRLDSVLYNCRVGLVILFFRLVLQSFFFVGYCSSFYRAGCCEGSVVVIVRGAVQAELDGRGALLVSVPCLGTLTADYCFGWALLGSMWFVFIAVETDLQFGKLFSLNLGWGDSCVESA